MRDETMSEEKKLRRAVKSFRSAFRYLDRLIVSGSHQKDLLKVKAQLEDLVHRLGVLVAMGDRGE
jgi:hypothetical protein